MTVEHACEWERLTGTPCDRAGGEQTPIPEGSVLHWMNLCDEHFVEAMSRSRPA